MKNITLTYRNKNWFSYQNLLRYYIYVEETYYAD
jgi:hypothetical protein